MGIAQTETELTEQVFLLMSISKRSRISAALPEGVGQVVGKGIEIIGTREVAFSVDERRQLGFGIGDGIHDHCPSVRPDPVWSTIVVCPSGGLGVGGSNPPSPT